MATEKRKGSINEVWNENITLKKQEKHVRVVKFNIPDLIFFLCTNQNTFKTINGHVE